MARVYNIMVEMISLHILILILLASLHDKATVLAECDADFVEIPKEDYDMKYASITSDDERPLGFVKGTVQFGSADTLCASVSDLISLEQSVEIMFETIPAMKLCYREVETDTVNCGEGRFQLCGAAPESKLSYEFFCDVSRGCSESDITFWYRITKGDEADADNMWCHWRDSIYPEDLLAVPDDVDIPAADDGGNDRDSAGSFLALNHVACILLSLSAALHVVM